MYVGCVWHICVHVWCVAHMHVCVVCGTCACVCVREWHMFVSVCVLGVEEMANWIKSLSCKCENFLSNSQNRCKAGHRSVCPPSPSASTARWEAQARECLKACRPDSLSCTGANNENRDPVPKEVEGKNQPSRLPLTSISALWHKCTCIHIHKYARSVHIPAHTHINIHIYILACTYTHRE